MAEESYEQALERDGRDLVAAARAAQIAAAGFREQETAALLEQVEHRRSALLVGPPGVGKTAIVHAAAHALARRSGKAPRIVELSTIAMMSGTRYLGEWETKVTQIVRAAEKSDTVVYLSDVWNLNQAGITRNSSRSLYDALRPSLEAGKLLMIGEATPELVRRMDRVPGFLNLFHKLSIAPLARAAVDRILFETAARHGLELNEDGEKAIVSLTTRFLPARPQPGPALKLLEQVRGYAEEKSSIGEAEAITPAFIERVFSIYSGLPLFVVSRRTTVKAQEIRAWFRERIVGQEEAIEAVVETISLFKAGLNDPSKPLGTLFFVGPTGVGKTEVARALATYLFGSPTRLLRFDMSEYKDYHSFELLTGSGSDRERPATLLDPVRTQPFQVVLLDELEKAHPNVWDLMLSLLDEGRLSAPSGEVVDFRSTILIATSNVGTEEGQRNLGFGAGEPGDRRRRVERALQQAFRPEFLNRFQHIVVFHPLDKEQVRKVARQELRRILDREGITSRNLVVEVDDSALDQVIEHGYELRYGARALKRELQRQVVLPLAVTLMEREVEAGQIFKVSGREGRIVVRILDSEQSRETRREKEPVRAKDGKRFTKTELTDALERATARLEALSREAGEELMTCEAERLLALRADPEFWKRPVEAARTMRELDWISVALERLDHLHREQVEIEKAVARSGARAELERLVRRFSELESAIDLAWLEVVALGLEGSRDAIVEVEPVGGAKSTWARDRLVETYRDWAQAQRLEVVWILEPREAEEPAVFGLKGRYPFGLLRAESGLHRLRKGDDHAAVRVRVAAWLDEQGEAEFLEHRALKSAGAYGGRVRSRLACEDGLVLQNERTLAENRELAREVIAGWRSMPSPSDVVVRRYDLTTPLIVDAATGKTSGRPDALAPARFHELLVERARHLTPAASAARPTPLAPGS
ncbi:MAG: AAA family ATPase [Deltaproteobacteria bacterium]|nr:AAA family ATPase [Deltaproteobacteria bacterium]